MRKQMGAVLCCLACVSCSGPERKAPATMDYQTPSAAPAPLYADPHYHGSADPEIVWNTHAKEWWIFYTGRRALRPDGTAAACPIGAAASKDWKTWRFIGYCAFDGEGGRPDAPHTYWAPGIIRDGQTYHMFVTYKPSTEGFWGGEEGWIRHYKAPASDLLNGWTLVNEAIQTEGAIDAGLLKKGGQWRMYYRAKEDGTMGTYWAVSGDLVHWQRQGLSLGDVNAPKVTGYTYQEAQYPFFWEGRYWLLTDPSGPDIAVYSSDDAVHWTFNGVILEKNGTRPFDQSMGRHPSVAVVDGRAFIFYHVEAFRDYGIPYMQNTPEQKRIFLQMAELKLQDGKLICDRDQTVLLPADPHPDGE